MTAATAQRACALLGAVWLSALALPATASEPQPAPAPAPAEEPAPVRISTSVEPKDATIGTPFRYTLRVEADEGVEVFVPLLTDRLGDFLITDFGTVEDDASEPGTVVEHWYDLLSYETGSQFIPGPPVGWRAAAGDEIEPLEVPKTLVNLVSLLARSETPEELRDIKGPLRPPPDLRWLWIGAAAIALAATLAWVLVRFLGGRGAERAAAVRPAHVVALEGLARLARSGLVEQGRHEEYYVRLSAIVREYVEARFGLRAPEMTTEEFLAEAQRSPQLAPAQRSALAQFLGQADLVKFARYVPQNDDADRALAAAREMIEATRLRDEEEAGREAA